MNGQARLLNLKEFWREVSAVLPCEGKRNWLARDQESRKMRVPIQPNRNTGGQRMNSAVSPRDPMPVAIDDYKAGLSAKLTAECSTLEAFRARWVNPPDREEIIEMIVSAGYSPSVLRLVENMNDYDLYDVLADLAYGLSPRTRESRTLAFRYKHSFWLAGMPAPAGDAIKAIADQFSIGGTEGLENPHIWQVPEVVAAGGLKALATAGEPRAILRETKERMFAA